MFGKLLIFNNPFFVLADTLKAIKPKIEDSACRAGLLFKKMSGIYYIGYLSMQYNCSCIVSICIPPCYSVSMDNSKTSYNVEIQSTCPNRVSLQDKLSPWEENWKHKFVSLRIAPEGGDLNSSLYLPLDTPCFLVWVIYSKGNPYGMAVCGGYQLLGVFQEESIAKTFLEILQNRETNRYGEHVMITDDKQKFAVLPNWTLPYNRLEFFQITKTSISA